MGGGADPIISFFLLFLGSLWGSLCLGLPSLKFFFFSCRLTNCIKVNVKVA